MALPKAGQQIRAADLAAIFPLDTSGFVQYTPVLTQSNTPTLSVEYAGYYQVDKFVTVILSVAPTSAGTASQPVLCTFPPKAPQPYRCLGTAAIFDASVSTWYQGMALWNNATTFKIQAHNTAAAAPLGAGGGFTAALASGDLFVAQLNYYTA